MFENILLKIRERTNDFTSLLNNNELSQNIALFDSLRTIIWVAGAIVWGICAFQILLPIVGLGFQIINLICWLVIAACTVGSATTNWMLIMLTTRRTDIDQDERVIVMWDMLKNEIWQLSFLCGAAFAIPLSMTLIPFIEYLRSHPDISGITTKQIDQIAGVPQILRCLIFIGAILWATYLHSRFQRELMQYEPRITEWLTTFEFKYKPMHDTLSGKDKKHIAAQKVEPSIVLGNSLETGDLIVQTPTARRQNSIVVGPIGAGKTSAWFLNQILQDIDHMIRFMRDYSTVSAEPDWDKPYGKQQNYLCGFAVIETTGDLCNNVLKYALKKGIPREKIIYYNPEDANTPSFSLLNGPVETATQTLTDIMSGLKKNASDFFSMQERTHLTQYIFLLKESAIIDSSPVDFGELMRMYNDVYVVVHKREKLRQYCEVLIKKGDYLQQQLDKTQDPDKIERLRVSIEELQDKYAVNSETLAWFDNNIKTMQYKTGVKINQFGKHKGEPVYEDTNMEFVGGLLTQLTELSKKMGLRRVLFRDNGEFSLDDAMKNGCIILCNTAKDMLGETSARMLGQIYSLALQGATFRRVPNVDPMFPIYQDEFPDYIYDNFTDFAAQARKYNVPLNIGAQSPAQLSKKFGPDFLKTIFSVMLTRATFGDMGYEDAVVLSRMFGLHKEAVESINEQDIDLAAGSSHNRRMISSRVQDVPNITPEGIMGLEKFTMAIRLPGEHRSNVFDRVRVRRITDEVVAQDPNNFDLNNASDRKAYEEMKAKEVHTNKDYDNIDKEIIQAIKDGQIIIEPVKLSEPKKGDENAPRIWQAGKVIIKGYQKEPKKQKPKKNGMSSLDGSKEENTPPIPDKPDEPHDGNIPEATTLSVGDFSNNGYSGGNLNPEEAKRIANQSTHSSPNGGNNRIDNMIDTPSVQKASQELPNNETKNNSDFSEETGGKKATEKILCKFIQEFNEITNSESDFQIKIHKLGNLKDKYEEIIKLTFPNDHKKVLSMIEEHINKKKGEIKDVVTGSTNVDSIKQNANKNKQQNISQDINDRLAIFNNNDHNNLMNASYQNRDPQEQIYEPRNPFNDFQDRERDEYDTSDDERY